MQKSLTALAATALIAGVGYATAQSTENPPDYRPMQGSQADPSTQTPATDPASPMAPAESTGSPPAPDTSTSMPPATAAPGMQDQSTQSQSSTSTSPDQAAAGQPVTTTTTTTDTTTHEVPPPPTGVTELQKPKGTVTATDKQPNGTLGVANTVMSTGVTDGATRPSVGDHATPPIPAQPTTVSVTTERTVTTTTPAPEPAAAPAPAPAPEPAPAPMPEPKADRN
jgi:hypothetical protein